MKFHLHLFAIILMTQFDACSAAQDLSLNDVLDSVANERPVLMLKDTTNLGGACRHCVSFVPSATAEPPSEGTTQLQCPIVVAQVDDQSTSESGTPPQPSLLPRSYPFNRGNPLVHCDKNKKNPFDGDMHPDFGISRTSSGNPIESQGSSTVTSPVTGLACFPTD